MRPIWVFGWSGSPTLSSGPLGQPLRELVRHRLSTMMRSVDMQICPWFMKAPKFAAATGVVKSRVVEDEQGRLAAQLQQRRA